MDGKGHTCVLFEMRMRLTSDLPVPVDPRTTSSGSTGLRAAIVATLRRRSGPKRRSIHVCVAGGCSTHCRPGVVGSDEGSLAAAVLSSKIKAACLLHLRTRLLQRRLPCPTAGPLPQSRTAWNPKLQLSSPVPCFPLVTCRPPIILDWTHLTIRGQGATTPEARSPTSSSCSSSPY